MVDGFILYVCCLCWKEGKGFVVVRYRVRDGKMGVMFVRLKVDVLLSVLK